MRSGKVLQFPLARGLAEDGNPKARPMSSLRSGNNIRWVKEGTIGKRYASRTLSSVGAIAKRFIVRDNELAVSTGSAIHSYESTLGTWSEGPPIADLSLEWNTAVSPVAGVTTCDAAVGESGFSVEAWVTGQDSTGDLYYQIRNVESGVITSPPALVSNNVHASIRALTLNDTFVVLFMDTNGNLRALTGTGLATLDTNAAKTPPAVLDACVIGSDFVVAYSLDSGAIQLARWTFTGVPVAVADEVVNGFSAVLQSIAVDGADGEVLYVLFTITGGSPNAIKRYVADPLTLTEVVPVGDLDTNSDSYVSTSLLRISASQALAVVSYANSSTPNLGMTRVYTFDDDGTTTLKRSSFFLRAISKPFAVGSRYFAFAVPFVFTTNVGTLDVQAQITNSDALLVEIEADGSSEPLEVVGKVEVNIAGDWRQGYVASVSGAEHSGTKLYAMTPFQATASPTHSTWVQGARLVRISWDDDAHPDAGRNVELQREAYVATGSLLLVYDGADAVGYSWPHPAYIDELNTVSSNGANGAAMTNGAYIYNVTPERRSVVGILHRGPVGVPVSIDVSSSSSNGNVTLAVATDSAGRPVSSPGHFVIYRSEANGSVLYRRTIEPTSLFIPDTANGATTAITAEDIEADNDIGDFIELSTRPQIYTDAGELEDVMPPAPYTLHMHQGRLGIITGDRREYWFTKDVAENPGVAPGFSPDQKEIYPHDLTACASLDDKRIMFWKRGIYVVSGDGPAVSGQDNRFTAPMALQVDVGCTNPRSVVAFPGGLIFECDGDLFALGRDLGVQWIGRDVRDTLAAFPVITSAVLVPSENEIRFTCNTEDGTSGLILVHDYERHAWFTRTYPNTRPIADAVLFDGVYYWSASDTAEIRYEDPTTFLDDGTTYVASTVELEDIEPAGPIGWQRVRIVKPLGQSMSNHALTVAIARDWDPSYEQTHTFAAGSDVTAIGTYLRAEVAVTVQRRQAIRVKFTDATPGNTTLFPLGNGRGFQLEGIALLVQPKPGMPRDTATRRGG